MAETDGHQRRKSSANQDGLGHLLKEVIEIKPRIDLIPDEFPRDVNSNVLIELVCGEKDEGAQELQECLENFDYSVTKTDKDREGMAEELNEKWIDHVIQKINQHEYDGLIMVFAKVVYSNSKITELWSKFTAQTCPSLKNKPKIFIFQIPRAISSDNTATSLSWMSAYETPAEADILIIHDMIYDQKDDLLELLATGIEDHGTTEDIFTLASMSYEHDYQPLIISTMTRKFYFTLNEHRGHYFSLQRNYEDIKQELDKIKTKLLEKSTVKKPKKSSFRQVIKKTFSFRNGKKKSEDSNGAAAMDGAGIAEEKAGESKRTRSPEKAKNNIPKKEDNTEIVKSPLKPPRAPTPTSGAVRKKSTSSELSYRNLEKRNSRTKTPSVSSEGKDVSVKKPAWKP